MIWSAVGRSVVIASSSFTSRITLIRQLDRLSPAASAPGPHVTQPAAAFRQLHLSFTAELRRSCAEGELGIDCPVGGVVIPSLLNSARDVARVMAGCDKPASDAPTLLRICLIFLKKFGSFANNSRCRV